MKKIVLKLEVHDDKGKQKAMKTVSTLSGIETLSIDLKEKKLTVIGDVDPVQVVEKLKKISLHPELLLVGPAKEPEKKKTDENVIKKDEGGKKDHNEKVDELVKLYKNYNPNMTQHYKASRSVEEFERLNKIGEGTYGVVYKARDKNTGEIVALKKLKISKEEEEEGFPLTFLREINILLTCHHPSIVHVKEVVVGTKLDEVFLVMEYLENDLKVLIEKMKRRLSQREVKCLMLQLLEGVRYLHDNWVIHRDLKTSNLLINNKGELKIGDFGLARRTQSRNPLKPNYTHNVVTLWYRSPELLLGVKRYSNAIDMWSVGCIIAELLTNKPIFDGNSEINQIYKIFGILGTPDEKIWPGFTKLPGINKVKFVNKKHNYSLRRKFPSISFTDTVLSNSGIDLLNKLLTYDPNKRITAEAALSHAWFRE